ncbi:hypothetical protein [Metabacillus fastidiosus]|uniref:hypothetical protein n=1 Tax=Metabacillus fastidiosus TaxID=1458 RepID=UPI003D26D580
MKEYSSVAVLTQYFKQEKVKGFWSRIADNIIKNSREILTIEVPKRFYLKNELICETVHEETHKHFNQSDLANHLIKDALEEYSYSPSPGKLHEQFRQISSLSIVDRYYSGKQELSDLEVYVKRKDILTLEMFLLDLEEIKDHNLTVEKLIELKYIEMCDQVLNNERDIVSEIIDDII